MCCVPLCVLCCPSIVEKIFIDALIFVYLCFEFSVILLRPGSLVRVTFGLFAECGG